MLPLPLSLTRNFYWNLSRYWQLLSKCNLVKDPHFCFNIQISLIHVHLKMKAHFFFHYCSSSVAFWPSLDFPIFLGRLGAGDTTNFYDNDLVLGVNCLSNCLFAWDFFFCLFVCALYICMFVFCILWFLFLLYFFIISNDENVNFPFKIHLAKWTCNRN